MNYIANEWKILKVLNTSTYKDMSLCEGRFTSRMKKLMQAPVKQAPVMPSCEEVKFFNYETLYRLTPIYTVSYLMKNLKLSPWATWSISSIEWNHGGTAKSGLSQEFTIPLLNLMELIWNHTFELLHLRSKSNSFIMRYFTFVNFMNFRTTSK